MHDNIRNYVRGWFVGKFEPSLLKADFEVMLRHDKKGNKEARHFHKQVTEYVVHVGGKHLVDGELYEDGDMLVIPPFRSVDYECLEDGATLCVKDKSIPNDKFMGYSPRELKKMEEKYDVV